MQFFITTIRKEYNKLKPINILQNECECVKLKTREIIPQQKEKSIEASKKSTYRALLWIPWIEAIYQILFRKTIDHIV